MDNDDVIASFEPVPPAPGKHYWNVSGATAWCARCGLSMRVVLTQLQAGYAPAPMLMAGSVAYDPAKHGRCSR